MEASSRVRATPVEGERGKPTLVEARHEEEQEEEGRRLTGKRGFSCQQDKVALATPMEGGEGRLLVRMSLAPGSLAASLEGVNNHTVVLAAITASPLTTTGSTTTSRIRDSTTKTRDSATLGSTTRTRGSTTRTTGDASATTA